MSKTNCKTCRFWVENTVRGGTGECRRNPPQPAFAPSGLLDRVSPVTGAYFWCGEHSAEVEKHISETPDDLAALPKWMTYAQAAEQIGTTPEGARQRALRGNWPRRIGADGKARVLFIGQYYQDAS